MKLNYTELRDKIAGCWHGKNAGGVIGAPFECKRGLFDVQFYTQPNLDKNPPANDDLDLQIAWLNAAETYVPTVHTRRLLADIHHAQLVGVRHRQVQSAARVRSPSFGQNRKQFQGQLRRVHTQ